MADDIAPTDERFAQALKLGEVISVVDVPGKGRAHTVVHPTPIIESYFNRRRLGRGGRENEAHWKVAVEFYKLAVRAEPASPKSCLVNLEKIDRGQGDSHNTAFDEMNKLAVAIGPTLHDCLYCVVFMGESADAWAKRRGISRTSVGLEFLRTALHDARRFWGM